MPNKSKKILKPWMIAIPVLALVSATLIFHFTRPPAPAPRQPSDFLPAGTPALLDFADLSKTIAAFKESRLGRSLPQMDPTILLQAAGITPETEAALAIAGTDLAAILDSAVFRELLGRRTLLALLPFDSHPTPATWWQPLADHLVIIARPRKPAGVVKLVNRLVGSTLATTEEQYMGHDISSWPADPHWPIYYTLTEGWLVAGLKLQAVRTCLDTLRHPEQSLSELPRFRQMQAPLATENRRFFVYHNIKKSQPVLAEFLNHPALNTHPADGHESWLASIRNLEAVAGGVYAMGPKRLQDEWHLRFTPPNDSDGGAIGAQPPATAPLSMVPTGSMLYWWTNNFDPDALLAAYGRYRRFGPQERAQLVERIEKRLGGRYVDILGVFGPQLGVVIKEIRPSLFMPLPELFLFVAADFQKASAIFQAAGRIWGWEVAVEHFQGVPIYYLRSPLGRHLQPAWASWDRFCVLALNRTGLKNALVGFQNDQGMTADPEFQSANRELPAECNTLLFVRSGQLAQKLLNLAPWSLSLLAIRDRALATQGQMLMADLIRPLLEGLSMVEVMALRNQYRNHTLMSRTNYLLAE